MIILIGSGIAIVLSIISFIINWNTSKKMKLYFEKQKNIIISYNNKHSDDKEFADKINNLIKNRRIATGGRV